MKPKKCRICKEEFTPMSSLAVVCSPECAYEYQKQKRAKKQKQETRRRKRELEKSCKKTQKAKAQAAFNKAIRIRDKDLPCISCGRDHQGQYHAGHYKTRGAHPELALEPLNCHKQCSPCNNHLSGNLVNYRKNLISKIGLEKVDWLEGNHELKNYTAEQYAEIAKHYREQIKLMEQDPNHELESYQ